MNKNPLTLLDSGKLLVAPSILSADFSCLGEEVKRVEEAGSDLVHLDIMDGHFVPNITFGPIAVKSVRAFSTLCFDTHLMISNPLKYAESFAKAGSDHITFHIESDDEPQAVIDKLRALGCSVGISLKPKTPASVIMPFLNKIDLVLVMTVEPGFGGQSFMADMMPKVKEIKDAIRKSAHPVHLQVDGGIDSETVKDAAVNGANMMVAGTSVFKNPDGMKKAVEALHRAESLIY
ncbi:MAG: ribulose-phosphate 3-epimerase [Lentisphaerae bacterium GWF2_45_14]|nr:MAG: ribulose-phosphate 3-epimerase [Lentisphaerae bacterium GWF2_45_14]